MVTKEEFETLKAIGDTTTLRNLWIKVYDDKKKEDGLISVFEIIETLLKETRSR